MSNKTKHRSREPAIERKNLAPVKDAVRDYRVLEDGAYAYHLQNEEIENHYAQNVNMRRTVMDDIRKAKELQDEEDRKARIMTIDEEIEAKQMDEELAEIIQEEIFKRSAQEEEEKKEREERDKELALLMEEKERRRIERTRRCEENDQLLAEQMQKMKVTPPASRDEERMKLMSDEELAKRLQDEEKLKAERTKQRKKELKSVVEMQDEELAKYIHDKEVEAAEMKFRKEKGKRKGKKKGKWDNEPLYYDDNVNPPAYDNAPKRHPEDPWRLPHDRHHSPSDDRREQEHHRRRKDERRPERPPPPKFSAEHNTEIKVPLDESQRRGSERHASRNTPSAEYSRDFEHNTHEHQRRAYSEKVRRQRGSADDLDAMVEHRPHSEKQKSRHPDHRDLPRSHPHDTRPNNDRHRERHHDGRRERQEPRPAGSPHHDRQRDHLSEHHDNRKHRQESRPTQTATPPTARPNGSLNHSHPTGQPGMKSRRH